MAPSNSLGRHDGASRVGPPETTIPESELETERVNSIPVSLLDHEVEIDTVLGFSGAACPKSW